MSEQKHTGGKWVACGPAIWTEFAAGGKASIADVTGYSVGNAEAEANAARIVSCVNALAGVEDPQSAIAKARDAFHLAIIRGGLAFSTQSVLEAALAALTPEEKPADVAQDVVECVPIDPAIQARVTEILTRRGFTGYPPKPAKPEEKTQ